ncbi:hypothetical protein BDV11DRAFT_137124 [Aspergillus similis]
MDCAFAICHALSASILSRTRLPCRNEEIYIRSDCISDCKFSLVAVLCRLVFQSSKS